jgi:hypothetical protein
VTFPWDVAIGQGRVRFSELRATSPAPGVILELLPLSREAPPATAGCLGAILMSIFVFGLADRRSSVRSLFTPLSSRSTACLKIREPSNVGPIVGAVHALDLPRCAVHFSDAIAETDRKGPTLGMTCRPRIQAGETAQW